VHTEKVGKSVIYYLKLSVLEDALLGFVQSFVPVTKPASQRRENSR